MALTQIDCFFSFRAVASYLVGGHITELAEAANLQLRFYPLELADEHDDPATLPGHDGARLPVVTAPSHRTAPITLPAGMIIASQARNLASEQLTAATLAALWRDNHDISDPAIMVPLADQLGMDGALLMCEALEADTQMILTEQQQHAASIGISAAPSYLLDGDIFSGSDGLNRLSQRLMQQ